MWKLIPLPTAHSTTYSKLYPSASAILWILRKRSLSFSTRMCTLHSQNSAIVFPPCFVMWWFLWGSNPYPLSYELSALPIELRNHVPGIRRAGKEERKPLPGKGRPGGGTGQNRTDDFQRQHADGWPHPAIPYNFRNPGGRGWSSPVRPSFRHFPITRAAGRIRTSLCHGSGCLIYSRSRAHAIGPRHIYARRLSGCQASLTSALPPRSHPAGVPVSPGCQTAASVFALTPMKSGFPAPIPYSR